jgi:hypothetical protein
MLFPDRDTMLSQVASRHVSTAPLLRSALVTEIAEETVCRCERHSRDGDPTSALGPTAGNGKSPNFGDFTACYEDDEDDDEGIIGERAVSASRKFLLTAEAQRCDANARVEFRQIQSSYLARG